MGVELERYKKRGLATHLRNTEDIRGLLQTVTILPAYIGAPAFKNESEQDDLPIVMLANFIMKHFPSFTPEMVVNAFEAAAAGKLSDDGKRVSISTYGKQMNIELLGNVLRVYSQHVKDATVDLRPLEERVDKPHLLHSGKEVAMQPADYLEDLILKCKNEPVLPKFHMYKIVHDFLVSEGELKEAPKSLQRSGQRGSLRELLSQDYHRVKVGEWLRKKGWLAQDYTEPIFEHVNQKPKTDA